MKITVELLERLNACPEGIIYFKEQYIEIEHDKLITELNSNGKHDWSNWLVSHLLEGLNVQRYGVFSAKLVLPIWEKEYPTKLEPRKAIEAVDAYILDPTPENAQIARDAARDAWDAARAASDAAWAAAWAAWAAASDAMYEKIIIYGLELIRQQETKG